jgi:DNA mismatch repair ATPase MutL
MTLGAAEMEWILGHLWGTSDPYRCPHGRAVVLRLDGEAIKKSFGRYW